MGEASRSAGERKNAPLLPSLGHHHLQLVGLLLRHDDNDVVGVVLLVGPLYVAGVEGKLERALTRDLYLLNFLSTQSRLTPSAARTAETRARRVLPRLVSSPHWLPVSSVVEWGAALDVVGRAATGRLGQTQVVEDSVWSEVRGKVEAGVLVVEEGEASTRQPKTSLAARILGTPVAASIHANVRGRPSAVLSDTSNSERQSRRRSFSSGTQFTYVIHTAHFLFIPSKIINLRSL